MVLATFEFVAQPDVEGISLHNMARVSELNSSADVQFLARRSGREGGAVASRQHSRVQQAELFLYLTYGYESNPLAFDFATRRCTSMSRQVSSFV